MGKTNPKAWPYKGTAADGIQFMLVDLNYDLVGYYNTADQALDAAYEKQLNGFTVYEWTVSQYVIPAKSTKKKKVDINWEDVGYGRPFDAKK